MATGRDDYSEIVSAVPGRPGLRGITFDVGNTLIYPRPSIGEVYARGAARQGVVIDPAEAERRFSEAWHSRQRRRRGLLYGTTHVEARQFWRQVVGDVVEGLAVSEPQLTAMLDDLYWGFAHAHFWEVNPGWSELRRTCRALGLRMALVSNWDLRLRGLLRELELEADCHAVVISAEVGVEKPDPVIFGIAAGRLGLSPGEVVHVGDSWKDDVRGAVAAGMRAIWVPPVGVALGPAAGRGGVPDPTGAAATVPAGAVRLGDLGAVTEWLLDGAAGVDPVRPDCG